MNIARHLGTGLTELTNRPYLWSDCTLTLAGSNMITSTEITLELNSNVENPNYIDGSRDASVPIQGNREHTLNVNLDLDSASAKMLYENFYKQNASFNGVFDLDADSTAGSQHTIYTMSGCIVNSMENPSTSEGKTESTVEIRPQSVSAVEYNKVVKFNPF